MAEKGKWNKLPTRLIQEEGNYNLYEAESPGLSIFVITHQPFGKALIEKEPILQQPVNLIRKIIQKEEITKKELILFGIIPLLIILLLLTLLIYSFIKFIKKHKKLGILFMIILVIITLLLTYLFLEKDVFLFAIIPLFTVGLIVILVIYSIIRVIRKHRKKIKRKRNY